MSSVFYKILWIVVHFLVDLAEQIFWAGVWVHAKFKDYLFVDNQQNNLNVISRTYDDLRNLKKKPAHLVVMLGMETPDFQALSKFVVWGLAAGVNYVSFYDHKGVLKDTHFEIYRQIQNRKSNETEQIVWIPHLKEGSRDCLPHKNGYARQIIVSFLGPDDGKAEMARLCQSLSDEIVDKLLKLDDVNIDLIDKKIRSRFFNIPDPDLAVYFGDVCGTYGLLPWQIRLTEFISIAASQSHLKASNFIDVLYKFAKCEQRFGK